jgi:hypothetical protein
MTLEVAVMLLKPGQTDQWYTNVINLYSSDVLVFKMIIGWPPFGMERVKTAEKKVADFDGKIALPAYLSRGANGFIEKVGSWTRVLCGMLLMRSVALELGG